VEIVERKPVGWRAREWRQMLDEGVYRNQSELARGEGVSTTAVSIALAKLHPHEGHAAVPPCAMEGTKPSID
jgi:hypothetical protein